MCGGWWGRGGGKWKGGGRMRVRGGEENVKGRGEMIGRKMEVVGWECGERWEDGVRGGSVNGGAVLCGRREGRDVNVEWMMIDWLIDWRKDGGWLSIDVLMCVVVLCECVCWWLLLYSVVW